MCRLENSLKDLQHVTPCAVVAKARRSESFKSFLPTSLIEERSARVGVERSTIERLIYLIILYLSPHPTRTYGRRILQATKRIFQEELGTSWPEKAAEVAGNTTQWGQSLLRLSGFSPWCPGSRWGPTWAIRGGENVVGYHQEARLATGGVSGRWVANPRAKVGPV